MTRSARENPPAKGHPWSTRTKTRALRITAGQGIAAAHKATGVPKATLTRWAKAAGINLGAQADRTRNAAHARAAQLAESTTGRLEQILDLATAGLTRRLETNLAAANLTDDDIGPDGTYTDTAAVIMRRWAHLEQLEPTRDLVGTITRAVHDLNLLRGEATERGDIIVRFGIPRPQPPGKVTTVDTGED